MIDFTGDIEEQIRQVKELAQEVTELLKSGNLYTVGEARRFFDEHPELLLSDIPGIGKNRCKQLLTQFGSVKAIAKMTPEELAKQADGVGIETAKKIIDYLSSHLG